MFLVCQTCFSMFWDESAFPEMLSADYDATIGELADSALCPDCAEEQVVCLSSTSYLNKKQEK